MEPNEMCLPDDILTIIKEFSQPVTRPDWRTLRKFTHADLYEELYSILHVQLTETSDATRFKNMILIFENGIFSVFDLQSFFNTLSVIYL